MRNPHALDLSVVGGGSAEAGVGSISGDLGGSAPGSFTYLFGDVVSLTATAPAGWTFDSWSGSGATYVAASGSASTTVTMPDADIVLVATFMPIEYKITATAGAGGSIAPSGVVTPMTVASAQEFTISADSGYSVAGVLVKARETCVGVGRATVTSRFCHGEHYLGSDHRGQFVATRTPLIFQWSVAVVRRPASVRYRATLAAVRRAVSLPFRRCGEPDGNSTSWVDI